MNNPIALVPGKTDKQVADEFKEALIKAHEPICKILDQITAAGFQAQVQLGPNAFGKIHIVALKIIREF